MPILFFTEDIPFQLKQKARIKSWIRDAIVTASLKVGNINYIFCSDTYILDVNNRYLNHDYFTDIITFDYCESKIVNSDIFISIDTVKSNSEKFNSTFQNELNRVIIHGILHLIGFDDKDETKKAEMTRMENFYLQKLSALS